MISLFSYFGTPGPFELIIVALVVLLLFGKRLPGVMGSLGKGIVEFKKGVRGIEGEADKAEQGKESKESKESDAKQEEPAGK